MRWAVFDAADEKLLSVQTTRLTEPVQGNSYADLVNAQSRVLAIYSQELAEAITAMQEM